MRPKAALEPRPQHPASAAGLSSCRRVVRTESRLGRDRRGDVRGLIVCGTFGGALFFERMGMPKNSNSSSNPPTPRPFRPIARGAIAAAAFLCAWNLLV